MRLIIGGISLSSYLFIFKGDDSVLTAIWLFENHNVFLAIEHYFSEMLNGGIACADSSPQHPADKNGEESAQLHLPDSTFLNSEFKKYQYFLLLYDTIMLALTPNERWLVRQRFDNGLTLSEIIELPAAPDIAKSCSSISRHMNQIINKSDQLLKSLGIQMDESS